MLADRLHAILLRMVVALVVALTFSNAAHAAPEGNTLKLKFGVFDIYGTYTKRSCQAQTFLRSARGQRMGFAIYWVPGKSLYLMTKHPASERVSGRQQVQFRFPSGEAMAFAMKRQGDLVQASIGFGSTAQDFYELIEANRSLRIELPGIGDAIDVDLSKRREVEAAMRYCRDWLKS